jgi:flavin-dependent dehydrogenase
MPSQTVESRHYVVVGAGPAGLRAAQVLAAAGRDVLVLERNSRVGPKTCGGGLSTKAVRELRALGLPSDAGLTFVARASFRGEAAVGLDPEHGQIVTLSRERLGRYQAEWATAAGAEIRTNAAVSGIDLAERTISCGGRRIRYERLIGADGSGSAVRRALGHATPRIFFAGEFNVPGRRNFDLGIAFDSAALASGYFWVFPHEDYTCIGAGAHKGRVRPASIRPYLERRMASLGVDPGETAFEGAAVEAGFVGFHFAGGVHLVGDAAGAPSGLTAEGIYAALISGEEVARYLLDDRFSMPKTKHWLTIKRAHDTVGRLWLNRRSREISLTALDALCQTNTSRRWLSKFFLET